MNLKVYTDFQDQLPLHMLYSISMVRIINMDVILTSTSKLGPSKLGPGKLGPLLR